MLSSVSTTRSNSKLERQCLVLGSKSLTTIGIVLFWLALSVMVVLVAFQVHSLVMIAGIWVIESSALRPYGWSSTTLSGISSFAYLVLGGLTLAVITFLEQGLSRAATENRLLRQTGKYALVIGIVWGVCFGLRLLAL